MNVFDGFKFWLGVGSGVLLTAIVAFSLHSFSVARLNAKHERAMTEQHNRLVDSCNEDKQMMKENDDALQKELTAYRAKSNAIAKRLRAANQTCVLVATAAKQGNGSAAGKGLPGLVGLDAFEITSKFEACDENTGKLIAMQEWAKKVQAKAKK